MSKYHTISDKTMDSLLESLEALVDALNDARYEVEYSVRHTTCKLTNAPLILTVHLPNIERRAYLSVR